MWTDHVPAPWLIDAIDGIAEDTHDHDRPRPLPPADREPLERPPLEREPSAPRIIIIEL
jgi:hypothetical protein